MIYIPDSSDERSEISSFDEVSLCLLRNKL